MLLPPQQLHASPCLSRPPTGELPVPYLQDDTRAISAKLFRGARGIGCDRVIHARPAIGIKPARRSPKKSGKSFFVSFHNLSRTTNHCKSNQAVVAPPFRIDHCLKAGQVPRLGDDWFETRRASTLSSDLCAARHSKQSNITTLAPWPRPPALIVSRLSQPLSLI